MARLRVYVDTSVFGGCFDDEFSQSSQEFFDRVFAGEVVLLISDTLVAEMVDAPPNVQDYLQRVIRRGSERLPLTSEAVALHEEYLRAEVVTRRYAGDALHVAQASLARADLIVSWNFRHLVNPTRIRGFSGVNTVQGYGLVVIMTPRDVVQLLEAGDEPT